MKKSSKRGFVMAETIIVSLVVLTALIILYTQFISINNSYSRSFNYNSVDDLYAISNVRDFILSDNIDKIANNLKNSTYVDLTDCSSEYFKEYNYCKTLLDTLDIKTLVFTYEDVTDLKNALKSNNTLSEGMHSFIKTFSNTKNSKYRLIAEFNDNKYATLKLGSFIVSNVSDNCAFENNVCTNSQIKNGVSLDVTVNDLETYNFNVIKDDGTNLVLLMNGVFDDDVYWLNGNPLNILEYLESKTNNWINVLDITYTLSGNSANNYTGCTNFNECTSNIYTMSTRNSKSRLITLQELTDLGCTNIAGSCPSWIMSGLNLNNNINGYWTSTSNVNQAWVVSYDNRVNSIALNSSNIKIKPVIMINKSIVK